MSGHCDFCNVWHSGSCCHPGRAKFDAVVAERDALAEEINTKKDETAQVKVVLEAAEYLLAHPHHADPDCCPDAILNFEASERLRQALAELTGESKPREKL